MTINVKTSLYSITSLTTRTVYLLITHYRYTYFICYFTLMKASSRGFLSSSTICHVSEILALTLYSIHLLTVFYKHPSIYLSSRLGGTQVRVLGKLIEAISRQSVSTVIGNASLFFFPGAKRTANIHWLPESTILFISWITRTSSQMYLNIVHFYFYLLH